MQDPEKQHRAFQGSSRSRGNKLQATDEATLSILGLVTVQVPQVQSLHPDTSQ